MFVMKVAEQLIRDLEAVGRFDPNHADARRQLEVQRHPTSVGSLFNRCSRGDHQSAQIRAKLMVRPGISGPTSRLAGRLCSSTSAPGR